MKTTLAGEKENRAELPARGREGGRAGKDEQTCERKCGGEGVGRLAAELVCNENEKGEIQPESAVCAVGNAGAPRIQHLRCFVKARLLLYFIQE